MQEAFLHYLWRRQKFEPSPWRGTKGECIELIDPGWLNADSGPDFKEAKVYINGILWAGQVELHVRSSDWYRHQHQGDPAYANVILHVVYEEDRAVLNEQGETIPCLELKGRFDEFSYWRYEQLIGQEGAIACAAQFGEVSDLLKRSMLDRMIVERLEDKSRFFADLYQKNRGDWEATFYQALAYSLGLKVNATHFLQLARRVKRKIWLSLNKEDLAALFFGEAGFLHKPEDAYQMELQRAYNYLRHKFKLPKSTPIPWQYARMRPQGFPERRLAILIALLQSHTTWHQQVVEHKEQQLKDLLFKVELENYWSHHYRFGRISRKAIPRNIGRNLRNSLVINLIIPYWYFYGTTIGDPGFKERALWELEQLEPEFNKISRVYEQLGLTMVSAYDTQAALQWHRSLCGTKKCLNCAIGNELLKE